MMDPLQDTRLKPSASKACSGCHGRKVKCDLKVPQCSACKRKNEPCNITECVLYPYSAIETLLETIRNLHHQLEAPASSPNAAGEVTAPALAGSHSENSDPIRKEAEEIGILAIGGPHKHSENKYVGSAAGSTFARIFFKQINLFPPHSSSNPVKGLAQDATDGYAALPPRSVARFLQHGYIARVHIWWPFLPLNLLRSSFEKLYGDLRNSGDFEKFLVFIVMALASAEYVADEEYIQMLDLNSPLAYYRTSLRFFSNFHDHPRDLQGLQAVLLLSVWMLNSGSTIDNNDLWQLSRYAMSIAIELGLHRHHPGWAFSVEESEIRNRTWWCAYLLERQVAISTGRVLSIRDHAVRAPKPSAVSFDVLNHFEAVAAPMFSQQGVGLFNHLLRLRQIAGRVLESVYIARDANGKAVLTSFQEICSEFDNIQRDLEQWKRELDQDIKGTREYSELKIEYCILVLLMNRPSSTFMIPSHQMVAVCSSAVSSAVNQWQKIESQYGISAVCRCYRQFHGILMVALAGLYCDWRRGIMANGPGTTMSMHSGFRHSKNVAACEDLMRRSSAFINDDKLTRYQHLLREIKAKVYGPVPIHNDTPSAAASALVAPASQSFEPSDTLEIDSMGFPTFPDGCSLNAYMSQVSSFLDDSMVGADEALTGWYFSLFNETQPQESIGPLT